MSFPIGEQFFIDSVREGVQSLPVEKRERFEAEVRGFVGQEATHRRIHGLFNAHLLRQGLVNRWEQRAARRIQRFKHLDVRHHVASTAAYEHFTAILAEYMLARPELFGSTEPRLQTMWMWHAAEESEHKSVAFDLYHAVGGNHRWRVRWFWIATGYFLADSLRQTVNNLWHDGTLFKWSTWASAWNFFLGRDGIARRNFAAWRAYLRPDFHPAEHESGRSAQWLSDHADRFAVVSAPGAAVPA